MCGHNRYLFSWIFINLTSDLDGWHFVLKRWYVPWVCLLCCHPQRKAVLKGTVWRRGRNANFTSCCYKSTSLWLFIALIIWLQCNFNWCTHHECVFSVSLLCAQIVEVQLALQSLPKEVLGTQGEACIFFPISCRCCLCFVVFVFFGFFFRRPVCKGARFFFRSPVSFWVCLLPCSVRAQMRSFCLHTEVELLPWTAQTSEYIFLCLGIHSSVSSIWHEVLR